MKKAILGICLAFVCFMFFCSAYAEESTAFSIIRQHLLTNESDTSILGEDTISAMIAELAQNGYSVSDREYEGDAYIYDVTLDILESVLGDYYDWSIEEKHLFDQIMVECGELPYCHNLLPGEGEIAQEDALRIALNEIAERFHPDQSLLDKPSAVYVSYYIADHSAYTITILFYVVTMHSGEPTRLQCHKALEGGKKERAQDSLSASRARLHVCNEGFHKNDLAKQMEKSLQRKAFASKG